MLKYLLVAFVLLRSATRATPTGNHTCTGVVKHEVTVRVNVTEPVTYRAYEWCLRVPPRCSTYTIQQKDRIKIHKEMHNRTITVCCKGYVEIDYKCVPACPPNMDCQNMHCNRTNHCYCTPGYTGLYCNDPCPKGVWGAGCIKECDCPSGYTCHHLTGDCMIDDSPPPKTRRTTTTTTTLAAETSTNFITSTSTKIPSSSTVITERPTPTITLPTSTSATERLTIENVKIISTVPITTTPVPSTHTYAPVKTEPTTLAALRTSANVITTTSTETMASTTMPPTVTTPSTTTPTSTTPTTMPPTVTTPSTTTPTTTTRTTMPPTVTTPTKIPSTITTTTLPTPSTEMLTTQPPPTSPITTTLPPTTITTVPSTTESPTTVTLLATSPTLSTVTQQTTEAVVWPKMNSTLAQEPTSITTVPIELTNYDTSTPSRLPSTVSTTLSTVPYFDISTAQTVQSSTVPAVTKRKPINPTMPHTSTIEDGVITSSQPVNVPYFIELPNISQATTLTSERTTYTFSTAPQHLETSTKNMYSTFGVSIDKVPTEEITTVITVTEKPITVTTTLPTVFETTMTTMDQTTTTKVNTLPSTTATNSESPFKNDNDIEVEKNNTKGGRSENYAQPTLTTLSAQDQLVVEPRQLDFDSDPIKIVQEAIDKYFPESIQNNVLTTSTPSTIVSTTTVAPPRVIVSPVNPDEIDLGGIIYRKMKLYPAEMATTVDSSDDRFKLYLPNYDDKSSETTIKTTIKEEDDKTHLIKKAKPKEKEVKKYKVKFESTLTTPVQNEDGPLTTNNVLLETKEFKVHLASTKPHKTKENFDQFRHNLNEVKHNGRSTVVHETTIQMETRTLENDVVQTESPLKPHTWYSHVKEKERIKNALKVAKSTTIVDRQFKPTESSQSDDESNDIHSVVTEYNSEREARSAQEEDSYEQELTGPQSFEKVKFQARQSYSSSVVTGGGNDKIYFVVFSSIGVVSSVAAASFVVVLGLKLRAKRRTFVDERETHSRQTDNSLSNYETIYPQTVSTNAELTTFFCPTFTNNYAERINREYREMSYDHPRRPSCAEPLYEEICRCSSNKY